MQDFFAMGGYALYVWTAWGAGIAVLAGVGFLSWRKARRLEALLRGLEARRPAGRAKAILPDDGELAS